MEVNMILYQNHSDRHLGTSQVIDHSCQSQSILSHFQNMHQKLKKLQVLLPIQAPTILCALSSSEQKSFALQVFWSMAVVVMVIHQIGVLPVAWILLISQNVLILNVLKHWFLIMLWRKQGVTSARGF
jgi:hypothetical protein